MEITNYVSEAIKSIDVDALFKAEIEKQIKITVEKALKDAIGSYSPLSKKLNELVEKSLEVDLDRITFAQYSNFVVDKCCDLIQEMMSDERAAHIKKHLRDKLAPHLVNELDFVDLIDALSSTLLETLGEADCCDDVQYHIVCEEEEKSYGTYWNLKVYEGERRDYGSEIAVLCMSESRCYHSRGRHNSEIAKRFASYVFNRTIIKNVEDYDKTFSKQDLI